MPPAMITFAPRAAILCLSVRSYFSVQILRSAAAPVMPAGVVERDFLEPVSSDLPNDILDGPGLSSENLNAGVPEHLHGPETHASGDDRFDLSSLEGGDRMALAVSVGLVPVVNDFDALPLDIDEGEKRSAAEMPVDAGLQALIRFGRNADLHGRAPRPAPRPQPRPAGARWMLAL